MPIFAPPNKSFTPAPAGAFPALCIDVVNLGIEETRFGPKPKIRFIWQLAESIRGGNTPFHVQRKYTLSMSKKSKLRPDLESWLGKRFAEKEVGGFDLESMLGKPCLLNIVQSEGDDGVVYANVENVMPLPRGMAAPRPHPYVRICDRGQAGKQANGLASPPRHSQLQPDLEVSQPDVPPEWVTDNPDEECKDKEDPSWESH
jgi:hypothetical protein